MTASLTNRNSYQALIFTSVFFGLRKYCRSRPSFLFWTLVLITINESHSCTFCSILSQQRSHVKLKQEAAVSWNINIFTKEFSEQKARRTKISQMLRNKVSQTFVENHYWFGIWNFFICCFRDPGGGLLRLQSDSQPLPVYHSLSRLLARSSQCPQITFLFCQHKLLDARLCECLTWLTAASPVTPSIFCCR